MNTIFDFIRAAAPWMAVGLAVSILIIRAVSKKKTGEQQDSDYSMEGMSLGMCFGLLIGTALENNVGITVSLGMLAGLAAGMIIPKKGRNKVEK